MTTLRDYPYWAAEDLEDLKDQMREITSIRKDDIAEIQNFTNIFLSGRKVGKVPSASNDVSATDKIDDFNWDASYLYILINNGGTAEWRRASLGSW